MTIEELYKLFLKYPVISTDSRNISPDSLFFAIKGSNFDGNKFAIESILKGARYAITDDPQISLDDRIIRVENVLTTLQNLATFHRKMLNIPVIAITGTNGKTTTKELINIVLSSKYKTFATRGNLNNHIGVPLTLLSFNKETEIGIVEMGANHLGEIAALCEIALPDYGIITNIGKAHIEGFGSFQGVIKTKTELYMFLSEKKAVVFCNGRNTILVSQSRKTNCEIIFYGNKQGIIDGEIIESNPFLRINVFNKSQNITINTQLIGHYNLENVLAAICIGKYFGIEISSCIKQIELYKPTNMRSQWLTTSTNQIIVDAYNANPTSMKLAIDNFASLTMNPKVIILGDMLELGNDAEKEHNLIIEQLKAIKPDKIILIGQMFKKLLKVKKISCFENTNQFIKSKEIKTITHSTILIKGSRGIGLEKVLDYL